jgi:hypothetical protein
VKYDDASWYHGGEFPKDKPREFGGTHIALFLRWCFAKGWAGPLHLSEEAEKVAAVINGSLAAADFLFDCCDGQLADEDLSAEGNQFASQYYGNNGLYLSDYAGQFGELMYVASESAHDYKKFAAMIDSRWQSGILTKAQIKSKMEVLVINKIIFNPNGFAIS